MAAFFEQYPAARGRLESITPLRRIGLPEDIGAAVVALCGPGCRFVTGQILCVDGGIFTAL
jgi:NAD(P)-dependent dehydrogenase (short-subunit alcohol dehydrogenase family)